MKCEFQILNLNYAAIHGIVNFSQRLFTSFSKIW